MNPQAEELNVIIRQKSIPVYEMLSTRGREIFFPKKGILGQTAEAKDTRINATIGSAIEDDGSPMRLNALASLINLEPSRIFPYAPSYGRPDLRSKWKSMIEEKNPSLKGAPFSLPVVTNALTHGISMAGYLFVNPGDKIIVPDLYWGNYNLTFANGYGGGMVTFNFFKNQQVDLDAFENRLNEGEIGKRILILNFPNNPTGYTPTVDEFDAIVEIINRSAARGNHIVCIIDDAYFGLVYEAGIARESIFTSLATLHENVLAVKLDGATKEDYVWGFRIGFISFGIKGGDAELYSALEAKTAGAIRGNISNASNISQSLLLEAYNSSAYAEQKAEKFMIMKRRYEAVKDALKELKYREFFTPLPFNSGYFMCVKLAEGLNSEEVRSLLIRKYSIGTISLNGILRLAFSSVSASDIEKLFEGIYLACKESKLK